LLEAALVLAGMVQTMLLAAVAGDIPNQQEFLLADKSVSRSVLAGLVL
jgi:hypothetical protein